MYNNKIFPILSVLITLIVIGCSTTQQTYTPPILPVSNEVKCLEGISGRNYHYLAWGIGIDNTTAEFDALKAAVYAAMLNGSSEGNCSPLMNSAERSKNTDFINKFFADDNQWKRYVTSTSQGRIDPDKRLKLDDGTVKLGVDVIVNVKNLREDLERDGIISNMEIK
jgi:hypothetical protein